MVKSLEKLTKKIFSKKHSYGFDFSPISPKLLWIILISVGAIAITGTALGIAAVVKDSNPVPGPKGDQGQRGIPGKDGACTSCGPEFQGWYNEEKDNLKGTDGTGAYQLWFDTICAPPAGGGLSPELKRKLNGELNENGEWKSSDKIDCSETAFYNWLAMKSREQMEGGFSNDTTYKIKVTNADLATNADNLKQGDGYVSGSALEVERANKADNLKQGEGYVGGSELIVDKADKADKLKNEYVTSTRWYGQDNLTTADPKPNEMPYATTDGGGNTLSPYMTRDEYVPSTQLSVKNAIQLYSGRGTSRGGVGYTDPTFMPMWNLNVGKALEADVAQKANRLYNGGQGFGRQTAKGGGWYEPFQSCLVKWSEEAVGNGRGNPLHD